MYSKGWFLPGTDVQSHPPPTGTDPGLDKFGILFNSDQGLKERYGEEADDFRIKEKGDSRFTEVMTSKLRD